MYAIIETCGKQYKVAKGDVVFFEKLEVEEGQKYVFDKVVLVCEDGKIQIGNPYVKGVKVEGKVISHGKGKKIIVYKMKPKKNYRRKQGHRQPYSKVEITVIEGGGQKAEGGLTQKAEATKSTAKPATKAVEKTETKLAAKPVAKEVAKPVEKPAAKSATKPATKAVKKPVEKAITTKPAAKPKANATTKTAAKADAKTEAKPAAKKAGAKTTKK